MEEKLLSVYLAMLYKFSNKKSKHFMPGEGREQTVSTERLMFSILRHRYKTFLGKKFGLCG